MPCNGVAVATAKVMTENEVFLAMIDQATIDKVIDAYLTNLGYPAGQRRFTVRTYNGRVSVTNGPVGLEDKLAELLNGLAGKMRQKVVVQTLQKAGVKINNNQTASNGAIVLNVEI